MHYFNLLLVFFLSEGIYAISEDTSALLAPLPAGFSDTSIVLLKDRLAVIPGEWHVDSLSMYFATLRPPMNMRYRVD